MSETYSPHQLAGLLDRHADLQCLSLDCFDTLLWRDTHAPTDIFAALPGITVLQRGKAESSARRANDLAGRGTEVTIGQIYEQLMPNATPADRAAAIEAEIAAEARHCFAFAPTVELMREAKARGLSIVIVSDTYLDHRQLRDLISRAAGEHIAAMIDRVYCSCEFGKSKGGGLYGEVLRKLKIPAGAILHVGDNFQADIGGVSPFNVNTAHLGQFSETSKTTLRLESSIDAILHPGEAAGGVRAPLPHRAALSLAEHRTGNAAERLGLTWLGPVLHGFERWLADEAEALQESRGGTVHWLFLMRDGHLPQMVHDATDGAAPSHAVEISRFTATAASLTSERAIQDYVTQEFGTRPRTLARQLLIPDQEAENLFGSMSMEDASHALLRETRKGKRRRDIIRSARGFADRLIAHIEAEVAPAPGDTLMLVDLGYNGTVQNRVDTLLRERLNVHVAGRYLLLREQNLPGFDKKGFIDSAHYDMNVLEALCANVAVLDQLCTRTSGSVVDYEEDGTPVRGHNDIKQTQSAIRSRVQTGCLRFQEAQREAATRQHREHEADIWRRGAASVMARAMFLPLPDELAVLETFEHDVNLGTDRTTDLFDKDVARRGLRQRGLFYMKGSERMYLPAELEGQGMATRLTLLAQNRFGLNMTFADFADARIDLPVIFANQAEVSQQQAAAYNTHDGFFMAAIPVGNAQYSVALQLGALYEWVELESLAFHPVDEFISGTHEALRTELPASPHLDGVEEIAPRLLRFTSESGFLLVNPPAIEDDTQLMLACVFRPIVPRERKDRGVAGTGTAGAGTAEQGAPARVG